MTRRNRPKLDKGATAFWAIYVAGLAAVAWWCATRLGLL